MQNRLLTRLIPLDNHYHDDPDLLLVVDKAILAVAALEASVPGSL